MTLVLVGKGPCFGGLTFQNERSFGFQVYICVYIYISKLLKNHHIPDEIQKS